MRNAVILSSLSSSRNIADITFPEALHGCSYIASLRYFVDL